MSPPFVVRVAARELRLPAQAHESLAVSYTLTGCTSVTSHTGDLARMQRNGVVQVLVEPGDDTPTRLVIELRNSAGHTVERRFDVVSGAREVTASTECS